MCFVDDEHRHRSEVTRVLHELVVGQNPYRRAFRKKDLAREFHAPLANQVSRNDDQDGGLIRAIEDVLSNKQPCLNRFPKSDFVSEKVPLHRIGQNSPHCGHLMLKQFHGCRRKTCDSTKRSALLGKVPDDLGSSVEKERRVRDPGRQVVRGIFDRMRPTHVKLRNWNLSVEPIRESNWVVVFGSLQGLSADQHAVDPTGSPSASVPVEPKHPRLRREFDLPNRSDRCLNPAGPWPNRRLEVLDFGLFSIEVEEFPNAVGAPTHLYKGAPCRHSDRHPLGRWRQRGAAPLSLRCPILLPRNEAGAEQLGKTTNGPGGIGLGIGVRCPDLYELMARRPR